MIAGLPAPLLEASLAAAAGLVGGRHLLEHLVRGRVRVRVRVRV